MDTIITYDRILDVFYFMFLFLKEFWYIFLASFILSIIHHKLPKAIKSWRKHREHIAELKRQEELENKVKFKPSDDIEAKLLEVDQMEGYLFEIFLRKMFMDLGYYVEMTPQVGDYGADLILLKDGYKISVQAKRYSKKIPLRAVQEVYASLEKYICDKGIVITNNYFTQNAKNLADATKVELWDRDKLKEVLLSIKKAG